MCKYYVLTIENTRFTQVSIIIYKKEGLCMFDVHLTTIKVIDIENNKVVIDSTFGEKEYVLDKIKNGVRFELPKYKSALQYQEKNDICYVFTNKGKKLFTALDSKLTKNY